MIVRVGSKNQVKVKAVKDILEEYEYSIIGCETDSGVSNQPKTDEEAIEGATNRARNIHKKGEISIGLEAGVTLHNQKLFLTNWGALIDENDQLYIAGGTRIELPDILKKALLEEKMELSDAMEKYFGVIDAKHHDGAIGYFTKNMITRNDIFTHIVKLLYGEYLKRREYERDCNTC